MTNNVKSAIDFAQKNKEQFLSELIELVKIPSISTDPAHQTDMINTAEHLSEKLAAIGMNNCAVMPTEGHPVVYADYLLAGDDKPTLIIYGHYDVQPIDPIELWDSPAFDPQIRDGNLYGRGTSDMKGQVMASIFAVEAWMKESELPINIKWLIEGEEEIGSPSLEKFLKENTELYSCDFAFNPDGGILGPDLPTIPYALRGLAYYEITINGPSQDLHSGSFGGAVLNPANELARLIGGMHDKNGKITLPGFYESVLELDEDERQELARLPQDEEFYLKQTGSPALWGEKDYTPVERVGGRPTLDVNGILSGFTGEGAKTVLPATAMAKISMRLVANQDPKEVKKQLIQYIEENIRPGVTWDLLEHAGGKPSLTSRDSNAVKALAKAYETVWAVRPLYYRVGGSIPVVGQMMDILGIDSVMSGFGLPDDNLHAPNEKLNIDTWYKGIDSLIYFFNNLVTK